MKKLVVAFGLIFSLALPLQVSALDTECAWGPLPEGRLGPDPTELILLEREGFPGNYLWAAVGATMAAFTESHTQTWSGWNGNTTYVPEPELLLNWKINFFSDFYKAAWTTEFFVFYPSPFGGIVIPISTDLCITTDWDWVPQWFIV